MRVIECSICGETLSAATDDELVEKARRHTADRHPDKDIGRLAGPRAGLRRDGQLVRALLQPCPGQYRHDPHRHPCEQHGQVSARARAVEERGAAQQLGAGSWRQQLADEAGRLGSSSGAEAVPDHGLPTKTSRTAAIPIPAGPISEVRPTTIDAIASTPRESTAAFSSHGPSMTSSQPWTIATVTRPESPATATMVPMAPSPGRPSRVMITPAMMPPSRSGSTIEPNAAPRGSSGSAGTTSSTFVRGPARFSRSRPATVGLAADASTGSVRRRHDDRAVDLRSLIASMADAASS